jgi:hypothetical protein
MHHAARLHTAHLQAARRWIGSTFLLAAAALATTAHAQKLAPGLWENTSTMKMQAADGRSADAMAGMQQKLASMPPEQRKMVEEMMAKQGVGMGAKPNTVRVCISPEQASRSDMPPDDGRCKREALERTGNTMRVRFTCDGPPAATGEGTYTLLSDKSYTSAMKVTTSGGKHGGGTMEMTGSARWVSADCGTLKPRP